MCPKAILGFVGNILMEIKTMGNDSNLILTLSLRRKTTMKINNLLNKRKLKTSSWLWDSKYFQKHFLSFWVALLWWFRKWVIVQIWIEQRTITLFSLSSDLIILVRSDLVVDPLISGWSGTSFFEDELLVISWNSSSFLEIQVGNQEIRVFPCKVTEYGLESKPLGPLEWSPATRFRMCVTQSQSECATTSTQKLFLSKWLNYPYFSVVAQLWIACLGEPANVNLCCFFYR